MAAKLLIPVLGLLSFLLFACDPVSAKPIDSMGAVGELHASTTLH